MFVPWESLSHCHPTIDLCMRGLEQMQQRLAGKEDQAGLETAFRVYGKNLNMVIYFQHYWQLLYAMDDDWPAFIGNIQKMRRIWACLSRILGQERVDSWTSVHFYLTITQAVFLFGAETSVVIPHIGRLLGGLHHRVVQIITGKQ